MILLQTIVSEFSNRFVQTERASIVMLITLLSLLVALLMLPRLARMLQRGDSQFNLTLWRWGLGVMFTFLFPSFLSTIILKQPISEVTLSTPIQPVAGQQGFVQDDQKQYWIVVGQQEKASQRIYPFSGYRNSQLGATVVDTLATPAQFGVDLWYPKSNEK